VNHADRAQADHMGETDCRTRMLAFTGLPKLEVPGQVAEKKPRLFELRTYEAHSRKANRKKVEMAVIKVIDGKPVLNKDALSNPDILDFYANIKELQED
jgi:hypothetical protein